MATHKTPSMLPPKPTGKREHAVNVRFSRDEQEALQKVASYRETTITELIRHVVTVIALPQMLAEMEREQQSIKPAERDPAIETKPPPAQLPLTILPPGPLPGVE